MGGECWPIHSEENRHLDQLFASPVRLCRKEGDQYVGAEVPLDGAIEIGQNLDDPKGFHSDRVPQSEDSGKRWRFRRNKWSITIPF